MNHEEAQSLLAGYALGALDSAEREGLEAHLGEACPDCERLLRGFLAVSSSLPLSVEGKDPRPGVKEALMRRLAPSAAPEPAPAPARRSFGWSFRPLPVVFAAYAALLCVWVAWSVREARPSLPALVSSAPAPAAWAGPVPGLTLKSGSVLQAGKTVPAGGSLAWGVEMDLDGGQAEVLAAGHAAVLLKEGARLRLGLEGKSVVADLYQGAVFNGVVPGEPFSVRSSGARVDAHGTLFLVRHIDADRAYVCICRGSIGVGAPGFERELTAADDAQEAGLLLKMGPGGVVAKPVKPVFYSDADEDELKGAVAAMRGGTKAGVGD